MKYNYLISESYCERWTVKDAIREVIANAFDSGVDVEIEWNADKGVVSNNGSSLEKSHLLLGESSKREDEDAIGQFGEGFKIAALVMTRSGRSFVVKSHELVFTFSAEEMADFGKKILCVDITEDGASDRVSVEFGCSKQELNNAKNLFRRLSGYAGEKEIIPEASGKIYVLGVWVCKAETLFGYDFADKKLLNRDRTILDASSIDAQIGNALSRCEDIDIIKKVLNAGLEKREVQEVNVSFYTDWRARDSWKEAIENLFGENIAIACESSEHNTRAKYLGYSVIDLGRYLNAVVKSVTNAKDANDVNPDKVESFLPIESLTKTEKYVLQRAKEFHRRLIGRTLRINITESLGDDTIAQHEGSLVILNRSILCDFGKTFAALLHESAHIESYSGDGSSSFEMMLTDYFVRIANKAFGTQWTRNVKSQPVANVLTGEVKWS